MALSLLEILFDTNRRLDGVFWMAMAKALREQGYALWIREGGGDFEDSLGWRSVAEGHHPDAGAHGFFVCDDPRPPAPDVPRNARVQVNVYRTWDKHDEPWALTWDPETKLLLDARRARLEAQFLVILPGESTEFGEAFALAARAALDGIIDDEAHGSLTLPDGSIEPYPDQEDERTPSVVELSVSHDDEHTPPETTPAETDDEAEDDPTDPTLPFVLECREAFTPQHAWDEMQRVVRGLLPYKGFVEVRSRTDWEAFGFADKEASGLTVVFERVGTPRPPPFGVTVTFDLYKTFDPSRERIAKIHHLAHAILEELKRLDVTAKRAR